MASSRSPAHVVRSGRSLLVAMGVALALALGLAVLDEQRESAAALDDFAQEQAALAASVAAELGGRLTVAERDALLVSKDAASGAPEPAVPEGYAGVLVRRPDQTPLASTSDATRLSFATPDHRIVDLLVPASKFLEGSTRVAQPGTVRALLVPPGARALQAANGERVESETLARALDAGQTSVWLDRKEAVRLGLPSRRAAAGLSRLDRGDLGRWGIAIVTTAERERAREFRARLRLFWGAGLAAGIVFWFGLASLRKQRRELALERELALAAAERERDVELAKASRAATLGTLAMGIAHEVSTPLGVIAGRAEQLLGRAGEDARATRAATAILEESEKIRLVIRGFLDLARGGPPALSRVDARDVLKEAISLVRHRFEKAGIALEVRLPPSPAEVHADIAMLRQAVANLLLNACDACEGGGRVEAEVDTSPALVAIVVLDDGAGIAPEAAARALEPFFTTKPAGVGSGLGLAIANEIVKLHRGSLRLEPRSPRGTRASIELPGPTRLRHAA